MQTTAIVYNLETGEARTLPIDQARHLAQMQRDEWSFTAPLPAGWDREVPKYRAQFDLQPAERERYRSEPPFTSPGNIFAWQYGEKPVAAGEVIETTAWPHSSFRPLNESGRQIHNFFMTALKSRLQSTPWRDGKVHLDNGLSFGQVKIASPAFDAADRFPDKQPRRTAVRS